MSISARRCAHALSAAAAITSGLALLAPVATAVPVAPVAPKVPSPSYTAVAVEPSGTAGDGSTAAAVNDRGQVAGNVLSEDVPTRGYSGAPGAVRWLAGGELSVARDIANDGTVVGSSADGADEPWLQVPTRWAPKAATPQQLPITWPKDYGFWRNGVAVAVSNRKHIAGNAQSGYRTGHATTWNRAGRGGKLLSFNGGGWGLTAADIAENGVVVGYDEVRGPLTPGATTNQAVVIAGGRVRALPTAAASSHALATSPSGRHIVGTADGVAVFFNRDSSPLPLAGARNLVPEAVTNAGVTVGNTRGADGTAGTADDVPALWSSGQLVPLAGATRLPSGWRLTRVVDINASGLIAGTAVDAAGRGHAVLLTPKR